MTPQEFMDNFGTLTDAPGGGVNLRKLVLGLALHGKLPTQSGADEPAQTLLKSLLHSSQQNGIEIPEDEGEAALPPSWAWVAVGSVADCVLGKMLDRNKHTKGTARPYLRNINVRWGTCDLSDLLTMYFKDEELDRFGVRVGDILICEGGEPGRSAVWTDPKLTMLIQKAIHRVRPRGAFIPDWLVMNLRYDTWTGRLDRYFTGATIKHFTGQSLARYTIRLPPLAEQKRIVAKVDQLMALLDDLEAKQGKRQHTVVRATSACLDALTMADRPEEVADAWKRVAGNWRVLFDRPEAVGELRGAVLELAVRGRLVRQDAKDGPASVLLAKAKAARTALVARGILREAKAQEVVAGHEPRFDLPETWDWCRIGEVFDVGGGIQKTPARAPKKNHYPYLRVENVQRGRLDLERVERYELQSGELERWRLEPGDLLVVEGNGSETEIGRCAIWDGSIENCVHQNHLIRCRPIEPIWSRYVLLFLNSPTGMAEMRELAVTTSGLYNLSVGKIRGIHVPFAPLPEQKRIVSKVDLLMALCDDLDAKLRRRDERAGKLVEAVVGEIVGADRAGADATPKAEMNPSDGPESGNARLIRNASKGRAARAKAVVT